MAVAVALLLATTHQAALVAAVTAAILFLMRLAANHKPEVVAAVVAQTGLMVVQEAQAVAE